MCLKEVHGVHDWGLALLEGPCGNHSSLELYGQAREREWTELVPGKRQWWIILLGLAGY